VFIKGKPTYITGRYFFYLNMHTMNTKDGTNRPSYRDRDMREYIFNEYAFTTTETFARIDEDGYAIKEDDGTYKMIDTGERVCFGKMQPKHRRSGNTNKAISNMLEFVMRSRLNHGGGIQSFSNQNAKETFDNLLMPAFDSYPIWIKPNTTSGRTSSSLQFNVGKNVYGEPSLQTQVTYATTSNERFYDSKKMMYLIVEEAGKTDEVDVAERHEVTKHTLSQGGVNPHGIVEMPSTVNEISEGAAYYRALSNTSDFYRRLPNGQTYSGIFRLFLPADDGNDSYIDSYGFSVKGELKDYQTKEGFKKTATEAILAKRDAYIKDGTPESMRLLRNEKKLFPMKYADCWLSEAGDIGFDMEKIDSRVTELRRHNDVIKGNFYWVDEFGGDVRFDIDQENGRFTMSMKPPESVSNRKVLIPMFSTFEQKMVNMWRPEYPNMFTLGCDPFRFGNKQDERVGRSLNKSSRLSDGGIAVLWNYDESIDGNKPMHEWDSYRFVLSYRYRAANTDDYNEDVLKAAIYFGAMVYPETNVPTTYEYFIRHNFGGFLLYDIDKYTNRLKEKPGMDSLERSKQEIFSRWRDYVDNRIHKEQHMDIINELKTIRGIEQMRHFDLIAAGGMALMGAKSSYGKHLKQSDQTDYNLEDFMFW